MTGVMVLLTSKIASRRLKMEHYLIDDIFNKLGINDEIIFKHLTDEYETMLVKYLNNYVIKITHEKFSSFTISHKTVKELILAIACLNGSALAIEPIWIIFKIINQAASCKGAVKSIA